MCFLLCHLQDISKNRIFVVVCVPFFKTPCNFVSLGIMEKEGLFVISLAIIIAFVILEIEWDKSQAISYIH